MKIALVGHGHISIPPTGYGAVESLIADYAFCFGKLGHEVHIVNDKDFEKSVGIINGLAPDVVWIHDDRKSIVVPKIKCPKIVLTSHDPKLFMQRNPIVKYFVKGTHKIGCLTELHRKAFLASGVLESRLFVCPNGARADLIQFDDHSTHKNAIACLAILSKRKRQHLLSGIHNVRFIGGSCRYYPPHNLTHLESRCLGEWSKHKIWQELTKFEASILLSDAEAAPLATIESLMAGLPVIVSESASANLPELPFVKVIPEADIVQPAKLAAVINSFMAQHNWDRKQIRDFAVKNFDWMALAKNVLPKLNL